jgi:hypothetical protein
MDLSNLIAGAKRSGVSLDRLVQDDQATLGGRLQSMFALLVEHASTEFDNFDGEIRAGLTRAFEAAPTFQAGLKALSTLHGGPLLPSMHELVSLVFMAFSIAILKIDEGDLAQYTGVMYVEMASWTKALSCAADKQAFGIFLGILWLPQVGPPSVGPLQLRKFCPHTNRPEWSPLPFLNSIGLCAGVTVWLCHSYVDRTYPDQTLFPPHTDQRHSHYPRGTERSGPWGVVTRPSRRTQSASRFRGLGSRSHGALPGGGEVFGADEGGGFFYKAGVTQWNDLVFP